MTSKPQPSLTVCGSSSERSGESRNPIRGLRASWLIETLPDPALLNFYLRDRVDLPKRCAEYPEMSRVVRIEHQPAADPDGRVRVDERVEAGGRPVRVVIPHAWSHLDDDRGFLELPRGRGKRKVPVHFGCSGAA